MSRVYIIAEAGVNHNGSLELAKRLVRAAAEAGVDAVKFQTFKADTLVSRDAPKADYQKQTTAAAESQYQMLKKLELSEEAHHELKTLCAKLGVAFLSTPFDITDIPFLASLDVPFIKVPSGAITDLPYLRVINAQKKPVLLSTGMATEDEVAAALKLLPDCKVTLLHCTTEYPCPYGDVNLKVLQTLQTRFKLPVGYRCAGMRLLGARLRVRLRRGRRFHYETHCLHSGAFGFEGHAEEEHPSALREAADGLDD